jgi:hypothetical protein
MNAAVAQAKAMAQAMAAAQTTVGAKAASQPGGQASVKKFAVSAANAGIGAAANVYLPGSGAIVTKLDLGGKAVSAGSAIGSGAKKLWNAIF